MHAKLTLPKICFQETPLPGESWLEFMDRKKKCRKSVDMHIAATNRRKDLLQNLPSEEDVHNLLASSNRYKTNDEDNVSDKTKTCARVDPNKFQMQRKRKLEAANKEMKRFKVSDHDITENFSPEEIKQSERTVTPGQLEAKNFPLDSPCNLKGTAVAEPLIQEDNTELSSGTDAVSEVENSSAAKKVYKG